MDETNKSNVVISDWLRARLLEIMFEMTAEQRYEIFTYLTRDFCKDCGSSYLPCHCTNDE